MSGSSSLLSVNCQIWLGWRGVVGGAVVGDLADSLLEHVELDLDASRLFLAVMITKILQIFRTNTKSNNFAHLLSSRHSFKLKLPGWARPAWAL